MKLITKNILFIIAVLIAGILAISSTTGCGIYRFNDASIPDSIKTIKINFIENRAGYINPQLSQELTTKLRQKITSQTKLSQTTKDNADWEVSGTITQYSISTAAITGQQSATNRLTVSVQLSVYDRKADNTKRYDVSRSFEFRGNSSFQDAEASIGEEMIRSLSDEIFNKIFSNW
jgi:outer membrane lipopolysaccharide assembly protein LptE/RlpB